MAQQQAGAGQQPVQVQPANPQAAQANPQLAAIAAGPRAGAVLAGTTVANLQVARLVRTNFITFSCFFSVVYSLA